MAREVDGVGMAGEAASEGEMVAENGSPISSPYTKSKKDSKRCKILEVSELEAGVS